VRQINDAKDTQDSGLAKTKVPPKLACMVLKSTSSDGAVISMCNWLGNRQALTARLTRRALFYLLTEFG